MSWTNKIKEAITIKESSKIQEYRRVITVVGTQVKLDFRSMTDNKEITAHHFYELYSNGSALETGLDHQENESRYQDYIKSVNN